MQRSIAQRGETARVVVSYDRVRKGLVHANGCRPRGETKRVMIIYDRVVKYMRVYMYIWVYIWR